NVSECEAVQKRGKERGRQWLTNGPWLLLLTLSACGLYWVVNREPASLPLKYGEFKQVLQDPTVTFQKVRVGKAEIRGEIVTRDAATGVKDKEVVSEVLPFHTPRTGLEQDNDLQRLLDRHAPSYQAEDEQSAFQNATSLVFSLILFLSL